jgi:Coenzyme PQQ synthesis protein D (PqqD)
MRSGSAVSGQYFKVAGPEVVHETADGETIIVNLETGSYYDLNHSGAVIFNALVTGAGAEDALAEVCLRYQVDRVTVAADAEGLLRSLIDEQLIVPVEAPADGADSYGTRSQNGEGAATLAAGEPETPAYAAPAMGKYTDMQELLLLDPVHEFDELGWPRTA